jgi:hypothetical protein
MLRESEAGRIRHALPGPPCASGSRLRPENKRSSSSSHVFVLHVGVSSLSNRNLRPKVPPWHHGEVHSLRQGRW